MFDRRLTPRLILETADMMNSMNDGLRAPTSLATNRFKVCSFLVWCVERAQYLIPVKAGENASCRAHGWFA